MNSLPTHQISKSRRILIVDPDHCHSDWMEESMTVAGYMVHTAANCREAERAAVSLKPHITILDEALPEKDTLWLGDRIKSIVPHCYFIIQTNREHTSLPEFSPMTGSVRYMAKTAVTKRLLETIRHVSEILDLRKEKRNTEASLRKRNRELEDINERLRMIVESTRRLTSLSGTGDIGPVILHEFAGNMNARGGSLFIHRNNELSLIYSLDRNHVPERIPLPLPDTSVMNLVISRKEPVLIQDISLISHRTSSGYHGYSDNSLLAFPLLEKNGGIVGIITLHNKITPPFTRQDKELGAILASYGSETLRATQAIRSLTQSEEKAKFILEANPDPVVVMDNERKVRYFNPAFTRVFGWSLDELQNRDMDDFIPPKALKDHQMMMELGSRGEQYSGIETIRYDKNGNIIPVSISGASFSDNRGNIMGNICNIRDITVQKTLEEQLVQSQKMEAIGTLASGIAHDFNNILSAIFGNLDLAFMDIPEKLPARKNIENIMKAATRAKDLVSQILSFSRKNTGHFQERREIKPHQIIEEALILLRASLPSTIEIKDQVLHKSGTILGDPTQFHQVIMNLCTNAHHAMHSHGGTMTIRLERITTAPANGNEKNNHSIRLTVEDTGCGMDEKTLKRIYDPYFTTKDKHLGTGLGLSVVRKITEDLNGRIGVKTYLGKGTRFELTFPEARSITPEEENHRPRIGKGSGKILFVDDEQDIAALSVHLLERLGYSVDALTHPLEALEKLTKAPDGYDLVITDMTMPKMTGIRLAENIKAIRPDIPIILCTGFNKMEIQDQIENRNINAILKKPVHLREFSETITRLMNRRKTPQPFTGRDLPLVPFMTAVPFNEVTSRPALKE